MGPESDSEQSKPQAFDFSQALISLRAGKAVARTGWNGKGQFIYLVPQNSYPATTDIAKKTFRGNDPTAGGDVMVPYGPYIAIKSADTGGTDGNGKVGLVYPWLASQADLLSDDWIVVD